MVQQKAMNKVGMFMVTISSRDAISKFWPYNNQGGVATFG